MEMPPEVPRKNSAKGLWVAVMLLSLLLFLSVVLNAGLFFGLLLNISTTSLTGDAEDEFPEFTERWSYGDGDVKAVRISVTGLIFRESGGGFFPRRYDKVESILRQIRAARNDLTVRAIILEVDSPGGAITPSDEIYQALMNFKQSEEGRKVIVHMKDLAASGGYYVAMAGDWLVAEPTAIVGSIGVIMQALNWKVLTEKIGLSATTIASGENKDLLNPFEEVSAEQVQLLQTMIDNMYERFVGIVQAGRGIDAEKLTTLADGRIFSADDALKHNLVDEIGYWDDVVARAQEQLGVSSLKIIRYEQPAAFFDWIARARVPLPLNTWRELATPRMLYLWKP